MKPTGNFVVNSFGILIIVGFILAITVGLLGQLFLSYETVREIEIALGWMFAGGIITLVVMAKYAD